jgi:hypothetical protein
MKFRTLLLLAPLTAGLLGFLLLELQRDPSSFCNSTYLGAILAMEIVLACLWQYETIFLPATLGIFLWAATSLPFVEQSNAVRWLFLGTGALIGLLKWIKTRRTKHFGSFHLVGLFCVVAAVASASASAVPTMGLLKAASLFLLFLYASTGARVAIAGREGAFVRGLVQACQVLTFVISVSYLAGYNVFGNPNNLGALIGIVITPILLWGSMVAQDRRERRDRYIALILCGLLLYLTACRAAIAGIVVAVITFAIASRRPQLLLKAAFAVAIFVEIMAVSHPSQINQMVDSFDARLIYKADSSRHSGSRILASRESPWQGTIASIKEHRWFGTGFGTGSQENSQGTYQYSLLYTVEGTNPEHGSSYLAMAEYMGLLGILPFVILLLMLIRLMGRAFVAVRETGLVSHYSVPFALVVLAGLVDAGFEDWLFASGSYLCVFFWVSAFLLVDLVADLPDRRLKGSTRHVGVWIPASRPI